MKKEKGITLISLIVYIVVLIVVLSIASMITSQFYGNTKTLQGNVDEILEFNKFNNYFLKEIKTSNNAVEKIENINSNYILFKTGNSFLLQGNAIYYNDIKVCEKVKNMIISLGKNGDSLDETVINVTVEFETFSKTLNYKIETIY